MRNAIALLYMVVLGLALRKRRIDEAFAIGFIPFFLLSTASYYYYVCRVTLIAWHASDLKRLRNQVFLAWLIGLEALTNFMETALAGHRVLLVGHLSWGLTIYAIGLAAVLIYEDVTGLEDQETEALAAAESRDAKSDADPAATVDPETETDAM